MSEDEIEGAKIDSFILNDNIDVDIKAGGHFVSLDLSGASVRSCYLFTSDEAERIGYAMLKAAAHIDPTRAQRIAVYLRGAGLTP